MVNLTKGEKLSPKSRLRTWVKPLATRRTLYFWIVPLALYLFFKIHLQVIGLCPLNKMLRVQVLLFFRDSNFEFTTSFHFVDLRLLNASTIINGFSMVTWVTNVFLQGGLQGGLLTILQPSIDSISHCGLLISFDDFVQVIDDCGGLEELGWGGRLKWKSNFFLWSIWIKA